MHDGAMVTCRKIGWPSCPEPSGGTEKEMASFACLTVKRQRAVKTDLSVLLFFGPLLSFAVTLLTAALR